MMVPITVFGFDCASNFDDDVADDVADDTSRRVTSRDVYFDVALFRSFSKVFF